MPEGWWFSTLLHFLKVKYWKKMFVTLYTLIRLYSYRYFLYYIARYFSDVYICVCVAKKKIAEKDYVPEISNFPANLSIAACFRSLFLYSGWRISHRHNSNSYATINSSVFSILFDLSMFLPFTSLSVYSQLSWMFSCKKTVSFFCALAAWQDNNRSLC